MLTTCRCSFAAMAGTGTAEYIHENALEWCVRTLVYGLLKAQPAEFVVWLEREENIHFSFQFAALCNGPAG